MPPQIAKQFYVGAWTVLVNPEGTAMAWKGASNHTYSFERGKWNDTPPVTVQRAVKRELS